jgi:hypothetical protein
MPNSNMGEASNLGRVFGTFTVGFACVEYQRRGIPIVHVWFLPAVVNRLLRNDTDDDNIEEAN